MGDTANRNVKVFKEQGGDTLTVASGGTVAFESGGTLSLAAGALLTFGVTERTTDMAMTADDLCRIYTTRGAGASVTFTLPAVAGNSGKWALFWSVADQNLVVAGPDEGLVVKNDLTADSISFQTSSEKIGSAFLAVCDGTSWLVVPLAEEAVTVTIASA